MKRSRQIKLIQCEKIDGGEGTRILKARDPWHFEN